MSLSRIVVDGYVYEFTVDASPSQVKRLIEFLEAAGFLELTRVEKKATPSG